jgi:hypothetical protein
MKKKIAIVVCLLIINILPSLAMGVEFKNPLCENPSSKVCQDSLLIDLKDQNTFAGLLVYVINLVVAIVGIISVAFIIYGGVQYITSRGDEEQATTGKRTLVNAIIGLVLVTLSYTLVQVIVNALNNKT